MAGDDAAAPIDEDGVVEAELANAGGDLGHLRLGVRAGIAGVGDQGVEWAVLDVQGVQGGVLGNEQTRRRQAVGGFGVGGVWRLSADQDGMSSSSRSHAGRSRMPCNTRQTSMWSSRST